MHSAIFQGKVRHRRFSPIYHEFSYRLFMMYIDLDEVAELFRNRFVWSHRFPTIAWFRRNDYLPEKKGNLKEAVLDTVEEAVGRRPSGAVRMLTHLRYFGYIFNPVTFYYVFREKSTELEAIVAEITNTPWRERHTYVLDCQNNAGSSRKFELSKQFHISPFSDMDHHDRWAFNTPVKRCSVHMENYREGQKVFDATMNLKRIEATTYNLCRTLLNYPMMTGKVIWGIYWNAFRLWWKGAPTYSHPKKQRQIKEKS